MIPPLLGVLGACVQLSAPQGPATPGADEGATKGSLACAPFDTNPMDVHAMDLDQKLGSARSGVAGVRVYDNSDIWAWRLPPMTPIRAMASGTVVGINSEEPWRCGEVRGFATRLNVQMDEPDFLQIGYVLIVPGVALGDRVATCSVIGDSLPELAACGSNFGFTAYDMRSGSRVDPFTWSVDGRSPRGLWGISDEDYARVLGQPVGAR